MTKKIFYRVHFMLADLTAMLINGVKDYDYTRGFIQGLGFIMENIEGDKEDGEPNEES